MRWGTVSFELYKVLHICICRPHLCHWILGRASRQRMFCKGWDWLADMEWIYKHWKHLKIMIPTSRSISRYNSHFVSDVLVKDKSLKSFSACGMGSSLEEMLNWCYQKTHEGSQEIPPVAIESRQSWCKHFHKHLDALRSCFDKISSWHFLFLYFGGWVDFADFSLCFIQLKKSRQLSSGSAAELASEQVLCRVQCYFLAEVGRREFTLLISVGGNMEYYRYHKICYMVNAPLIQVFCMPLWFISLMYNFAIEARSTIYQFTLQWVPFYLQYLTLMSLAAVPMQAVHSMLLFRSC